MPIELTRIRDAKRNYGWGRDVERKVSHDMLESYLE
jgi:hypothetical protein